MEEYDKSLEALIDIIYQDNITIPQTKTPRSQLIKFLGSKCRKCGYDKDIRALEIDHILNNGNEDRRSGRDWGWYVKNTIAAASSLQLLCAICHRIKTSESQTGLSSAVE